MRSWLRIGITAMGVLSLVSAFLLPARSSAQVADAHRVMILWLQPQDGASDRFGRDVANGLRDVLRLFPAHEPIDEREVRDAADQYDLDFRRLGCVQGRQLANLLNVSMLFCGEYSQSAEDQSWTTTGVQFAAPGGSSLEIEDRTWGRRDARPAAEYFSEQLAEFTEQQNRAAYCGDYYRAEDWVNAEENCGIALELDPSNTTVRYVYSHVKQAQGLHGEAYDLLLEVIEQDRLHEDALLSAGYLAATELQDKAAARRHYEAYLELNPGNAQVRMNVAYELLQAGDAEGAMLLTEEGLEIEPDNVDLLEMYGSFATLAAQDAMGALGPNQPMSMEVGGFFTKAAEAYRKAYEIRGAEMEAGHLRNMIASLYQLGQLDEAADISEQVLETHGEDGQFWSLYADILNRIGRVDDALAALESLVEINPEYPNVRARQGTWLLAVGREDEALPYLQQAVEAGEQSADQVANNIFATGYRQGVALAQQATQAGTSPLEHWDFAIKLLGMAKSFDDQLSERMSGQIDFWYGYSLYQKSVVLEEPQTLQTAELTLPLFEQVRQILAQEKVTGYAAAADLSGNLSEVREATERFIEIQEALIERGRRR
jgi:tetratricopeptide (TPR) repeat protein